MVATCECLPARRIYTSVRRSVVDFSWRPEILSVFWGFVASPFSSSWSPPPPVPQSTLPFSALMLTGLSPVLIHPLWSPAAQRETSEDCRSCLECSRDNGCVRCPERLFLFLQREGMSHHGTCLHACPAGHYGQRGKDINRCMSMSQTNPQKKMLAIYVTTKYRYVKALHFFMLQLNVSSGSVFYFILSQRCAYGLLGLAQKNFW